MEILIKSYEYRLYPAGHVYKTKIETLRELQELFYRFQSDGWKRAGEACFKTANDDAWLEYEEFILKYFKYQLRRPFISEHDLDLIGFEDQNGRLKSIEEMRREREVQLAEIEAISREKYYEELILNMERITNRMEGF
ncbi:hypothetical protein ACQKNC_15935 [Lysinibacillus sp. NPDC094177]|uniref:hypothetical protein n=1 Tax=Lysinibacillus sp. NPDC094177 TaxID=3390580 RepID=UPI003D04EFF5